MRYLSSKSLCTPSCTSSITCMGDVQYPLNENEVHPLPRTRNEIQHLSCWLPGHQPNKEEKIGGQETRTRVTLSCAWIPAP